jgi:hypothetical protein
MKRVFVILLFCCICGGLRAATIADISFDLVFRNNESSPCAVRIVTDRGEVGLDTVVPPLGSVAVDGLWEFQAPTVVSIVLSEGWQSAGDASFQRVFIGYEIVRWGIAGTAVDLSLASSEPVGTPVGGGEVVLFSLGFMSALLMWRLFF